jgi:hypothetical protein
MYILLVRSNADGEYHPIAIDSSKSKLEGYAYRYKQDNYNNPHWNVHHMTIEYVQELKKITQPTK